MKKISSKYKIKAKPLKRLPKKLGDDAYAYTAALLEDANSNFRAFAEGLNVVTYKVDVLTYEMGKVKEDITEVKIAQDLMRGDISELNERQTRMEADIKEIKQELKSIKNEMGELRTVLSKKADIDRLNSLEERVARIEQNLQLRH